MLNDIKVAFALESTETLNGMELAILALEQGDPEALDALFRHAHTLKGSAGIVGLRRLEAYAHQLESRLSKLRGAGSKPGADACGALLACKDRCAAIMNEEPLSMGEEDAPDTVPADELLVEADLKSIAGLDEALGFAAGAAPAAEAATPRGADDDHPDQARSALLDRQGGIRVSDAKLDVLVNLAGELVTVQAQFSRMASDSSDRAMLGLSETLKRLVGELRSAAMDMRLVPADTLFGRFRRMARDLSKELGKEVELEVKGGATELDKSVIEGLSEPMVHLVRNALDHGIEMAGERLAAGKPAAGRLSISAGHEGASVRIVVKDDGRGVDPARVLAKAIERGLVAPGENPPKEELYKLIFAPAFSTAGAVSTVSGRGYGLDIVKSAVERLGGEIHLESEPGRGASFILDIPLTIAIIDGFLAKLADRLFIVPLGNVAECYERPRPPEGLRERLIERNGELIPLVHLEEVFGIEAGAVDRAAGGRAGAAGSQEMIVATAFGAKVALAFDRLLGGYQTVIKPLGELASRMTGISGSAILPDGAVALILDVGSLSRLVRDGS
jgi:two-component system chemotaxis sensor kinase CheA